MRPLLLAGLLALAVLPAGAQELQPTMTLKVAIEDAMLIVQILGSVQCNTVLQQLQSCDRAKALLRSLQEQAKAQGPQ